MSRATPRLEFADGKLSFRFVEVNSCFASVTVDFLRGKLLDAGMTFTISEKKIIIELPRPRRLPRKAEATPKYGFVTPSTHGG